MSLKSLNKIDSLYDQLFQAQIEHRWKDADLISKELQRLEREEGEGKMVEDTEDLWYYKGAICRT